MPITEVVLKNDAGWTVEVLAQFLGFEGVTRVDGGNLSGNKRFAEAHIVFRSPALAAHFAQVWAANAAKKKGKK